MKKLLSSLVMAFLLVGVFASISLVIADGDDVGIGIGVITEQPTTTCYNSTIAMDNTARGWYPNDQTIYTSDIYGTPDAGGKYNCGVEYDRYANSVRQNYVFAGETVDYYVLVSDSNGVNDIDNVQITLDDGTAIGACAAINLSGQGVPSCGVAYDAAAFGKAFDSATDKVYICKFIVPQSPPNWAKGEQEIRVQVTDGANLNLGCTPTTVELDEADKLYLNPTLSLKADGMVQFGTVSPGTVATSNSIYLENENIGQENSGVVMDVYIASDDYFTDSTTPGTALCPTGNGIKYDRFSYYATKGSLNSGANDNQYYALGETDGCKANDDEFTTLPSHSGEISDMCRIINWQNGGSLLTQGAEMSIKFRLSVPNPCVGNFDTGQFHFVGRVV